MRSELQFFMLEADEKDFLNYAKDITDGLVPAKPSFSYFMVGEIRIQYQPSERIGNVVTAGRIAIGTDQIDDGSKNQKRAEKVYNSLRRWIKKHYTNKLQCRSESAENSVMSIRNFWVGPIAEAEMKKCRDVVFRQFPTGAVVFELDDMNDRGPR